MDEYEAYDNGLLLRDRYSKVARISEGSYGLVSVAKDTLRDDTLVAVKYIYPIAYKQRTVAPPTTRSQSPSITHSRSSSAVSPSPADPRSSSKRLSRSLLPHSHTIALEAQKEIIVHDILGVHPNIARLYDHFDSFLVMEYCSRGDLHDAINNNMGPLSSGDIKDVFLHILEAIAFCHSKGVYHRDLKPENILVADDWLIKLCDWGLATTTRHVSDPAQFDVGSERYMAPELFDPQVESYDASKLDVWAAGIVLLTIVFRKNPFQIASNSDKRFVQFLHNREALFDFFSTMLGDMFAVLRYCLNIDPTNRDLEALREGVQDLKYFTIDEEYWASEGESEPCREEDDEYRDLDETDDSCSDKLTVYSELAAPSENREHKAALDQFSAKNIPLQNVLFDDDTKFGVAGEHAPAKPQESQSFKEKTMAETYAKQPKQEPGNGRSDQLAARPHNHRADALLSESTTTKPIPISEAHRVPRNARVRQPLNVASFNQSAGGRFFGQKMAREDCFTPKSVFNHYMDKYAADKFNTAPNPMWRKHKPASRNKTWKTAGASAYKPPQNRTKLNGNAGGVGGGAADPTGQYRRKLRLYSQTRRPKVINPGWQSAPHSAGQQLHPPALIAPSSAGSAGKYKPPAMRSPMYSRSPLILPLLEEIDAMTLDADTFEEVFELEDDFEWGGPDSAPEEPVYASTRKSHGEPILPPHLQRVAGQPAAPLLLDHPSFDGAHAQQTPQRTTPLGFAGAKYIPPFRRASHGQPTKPETVSSSLSLAGAQPGLMSNVHADQSEPPLNPLAELSKLASNSKDYHVSSLSSKMNWSDFE